MYMSIRPVHKNATTSNEGNRSDTPKISPRIEGMVAQCTNTTASQPIVSDEYFLACSVKYSLILSKSGIQFVFVEDVSSDLGELGFVPSWVDVVGMIV